MARGSSHWRPALPAQCLEEVLFLDIGLFFPSGLQCGQYGISAAVLAPLAQPAQREGHRARTPALLLLTSLSKAVGARCQAQLLDRRLGLFLVFSGYGHHIGTA